MTSHDTMTAPPRWFRPAAVVALLWNLIGCAAYLADVTLSAEDVAKMTDLQQSLYRARPAWSVGATAVAVWFGAAGCVGLILRKHWATWLLVASLAGVVLQDLWLFVLSGASWAIDFAAIALQGVVLVVSVALVYLARAGSARGWLL